MTVHRRTRKGRPTPEYAAWKAMKSRCGNPAIPQYRNYGGRGIRVCDRWRHSFENFMSDMGPRPSRDHSVDRIDNDGNYEPSNCRWTTWKVQGRNTRRSIFVFYQGKRVNVNDLSERLGIQRKTLLQRILNRWSEKDLSLPLFSHFKLRNRKDNVFTTYMGERVRVNELAHKLGIDYDVLRRRIELNWSENDLILPLGTRRPQPAKRSPL